jgi:hypothetical protein
LSIPQFSESSLSEIIDKNDLDKKIMENELKNITMDYSYYYRIYSYLKSYYTKISKITTTLDPTTNNGKQILISIGFII